MDASPELYWDKKTVGDSDAALEAQEDRNRRAGCQIHNRCTQPPYEQKNTWECDEFPFKTVEPNELTHTPAINRCVPRMQNKCECRCYHDPMDPKLRFQACILTLLFTGKNDLLQDFYKSQGDWSNGGGLQNKDNWFKLAFQNYGGITYCEDASNKCVNGMSAHGIRHSHQVTTSLMWT